MFNRLSASYKRYNCYDYEHQPPEKKLVSDGDNLIKKLAEKQQNRKITLEKELSTKNKFYKSTEMVSVTQYVSGTSSLEDFSTVMHHAENLEHLKKCGLTNDEIDLFIGQDKGNKSVHKNLNETVLKEELTRINNLIKSHEKTTQTSGGATVRKKLSLSEKPESVETKLLKFALENEEIKKETIPGPMDEIKKIEAELTNDLSRVDIKKIRKKARSLARQIEEIGDGLKPTPSVVKKGENCFLSERIKWDVKEVLPETSIKTLKSYTCKNQNFYTIRNGEICKINNSAQELSTSDKKRVSIEEIRSIPKFNNYEKGTPSSVLYLKNLHRSVKESELETILGDFFKEVESVKIMDGRMRGQAFLKFKSVEIAERVLDECNGTILKNRPLIIQFSKKDPND